MKTFTDSQMEAVNLVARGVACVAGPGSGKTSVLVARVGRLLADPYRNRVGVLTFTNAAARNLVERIAASGFAPSAGTLRYCGTLHAFALRTLRDHGARIGYGPRLAVLDEDAAADLLASKAQAMGSKTPLKKLLALKACGRADLARRGFAPSVDETVACAYLDDLRENGLVDLDSLLPEFLRLILSWNGVQPEGWGFDHLLVDEVQDSSAQDWAIYHALPVFNKFFVGDPDQAIYAFRGGRQDLFLEYARRLDVNRVTLEENFRCRVEVCAAANNLIRHNVRRLLKNTFPGEGRLKDHGVVTRCGYETEGEEVGQVVVRIRALMVGPDPVEPSQIAVLARTNAIAAPFRDALKAAGIPVAEAPKNEAPPDWGLARALIELLAQPDNDTLAFFYVAARERRRGATASEAAHKAHGIRLEAGKTRQSVNALWFKLPRNPAPVEIPALLEREGLTAETRAHVYKLISQLPLGSGVLELAADMGSGGMFYVAEAISGGVHVGTVHAAKGREWDQVFLVGYEDEVTPALGKGVGDATDETLEEERRLAFVGVTRARVAAHFTHAAQRRATWGRQEVLNRTASRFIGEAVQ